MSELAAFATSDPYFIAAAAPAALVIDLGRRRRRRSERFTAEGKMELCAGEDE